jgi:unsaturated rhamnogalacturonyl hydrolase
MNLNRRNFLAVSLAAGASAGGIISAADTDRVSPTGKEMDRTLDKVKKAMLAMQRYSWEQGVAGQALWESGDRDMAVLLAKASLINTTEDGRLAAIGGGATDPGMAGEMVWRAAQLTGDRQLQEAADNLLEYLLKRAPRADDGTLYHIFGSPEIWSDSFYAAPPYLAVRGRFDEAIKQIDAFRKRLWDPQKKLLSHMWDEGKRKFKRKDFWGVGNGWAAAGITRVIQALLPERGEDKKRLVAYLKDLLDGCLAFQRTDGLFHDIIDNPKSYVETNLGQMLAYSIYTGVAAGWLSADYIAPADRMRQAAHKKVDQYGLVQDVCGAPKFDSAGVAAEGQAFFILMESVAKKQL